MEQLLQRQASRAINAATTSSDSIDFHEHLKTLQNECQRICSEIENPVERMGCQKLIDSAITQIFTRLSKKNEPGFVWTDRSNSRKLPLTVDTTVSSPDLTHYKKNTYRMRLKNIFGVIQLTSTTWESVPLCWTKYQEEDENMQHNIESTVKVHPARWVQTSGIRYGLQLAFLKSFSGLSCKIRSYYAVPDNARIFELCNMGDVDGVKALLDRRAASPWDTNSKGFTPLFVSDVSVVSYTAGKG
jgi:hypothetical protein